MLVLFAIYFRINQPFKKVYKLIEWNDGWKLTFTAKSLNAKICLFFAIILTVFKVF
jgi:hypothetical protein